MPTVDLDPSRHPVVLLDMNGTFVFGGDRFGPSEDYAATYRSLGGTAPGVAVDAAVGAVYDYLDRRYTDAAFHEAFPNVADALGAVPEAGGFSGRDLDLIARTFARHELGRVPPEYARALCWLAGRHRLGLVTDIWAGRELWIQELARAGVLDLFDARVFSSDGSSVKPSPEPFRRALRALGARASEAVVIGDSAHRDGGGALAAGLPFILVGAEEHPDAIGRVESLLALVPRSALDHSAPPSPGDARRG